MENSQETKLYEISFLFTPLATPEEVAAKAEEKFRAALTTRQGEFLSLTPPRNIALAYPIRKMIGRKRETFRSAYFFAARFNLPSENLADLKKDFSRDGDLIRFLFLKLPPAAAAEPLIVSSHPTVAPLDAPPDELGKIASPEAPIAAMTSAEIDKEIDQLLTTAV